MSGNWIVHHDAASADDELGGKAAALARLGRFGVPAWFVVTPAARRAAMDGARGEDAVRAAIRDASARIGDEHVRFAVRSSALCEDGAQHSFAGQFESYLHVAQDDVWEAVERVWASAESSRVATYRRERAAGEGRGVEMGVLVQRMVDAVWAGVAFAVDPVTGDEGVVVSGVAGTAEQLVSGGVGGVTVRVDRGGTIEESRPDEGGAELDATLARRVARLALDVSSERGSPQDIEWAFDGHDLFLLQARPITTAPAGEIAVWDNSNIAESYSGVTTPLTFSFARKAYEEVYRTFCALMGVPNRVVEEHAQVFRHMLGFLDGRVYYNLMNWYRLISMLPGYSINAPFMEQMMGVRSGLPESALRVLRQERTGSRAGRTADALRLARSCLALARLHATLNRSIRAFDERIDRMLGNSEDPFAGMSARELVERYRVLERVLLPGWDAPILNDFFAMIYVGTLRKLCVSLAENEAESLHNALLLDVGDIISVEPARRIERLAAMARRAAERDPGIVGVLEHAGGRDALGTLGPHTELRTEIDRYIRDFGDRCLQELKLESPTLRDDPTPLLRSIAAMSRRDPIDPDARESQPSEPDPTIRFRAMLRGRPLRALQVRFVLPRARARLRDRENLRFARTRVFGHVRRLFLALANRYTDLGLLSRPQDIFFLEVEEALGLATGTATTVDVRGIVALRRAAFERQRREDPLPSRFDTRGPVNPLRPIVHPESSAHADDDPSLLRGVGCCPGIVVGRARVVRDPIGIELAPGDVLIAERTDPGWVMLFPAASAIAVEHGSILSHTSIVARELGVPCVVGVPRLLASIEEGDRLELDGTAGTLRRLDAE